DAACRPAPALAERERLGVVVDEDREAEALLEPGAQRKPAPRGDVEWRNGLAAAHHRTAASDPDRDRVGRIELSDHALECAEELVGIAGRGRRRDCARRDRAAVVDDAGGELRAPDVDRDDARRSPGHVTSVRSTRTQTSSGAGWGTNGSSTS